MSNYLVDVKDFKTSEELNKYLTYQEEHLFECLRGTNHALKPKEIKNFVPELARHWKSYLNTPGVSSSDQKRAIIHCAELVRFHSKHQYSIDYEKLIQDSNPEKLNALEITLRQQEPTLEDMLIVRDLRLK